MNKYLITILLLAGCTGNPMPYKCYSIDGLEQKNPVISVGDIFCVTNSDDVQMNKLDYSMFDLKVFLLYNTKDQNTQCRFYDQSLSKDYFVFQSGKKVDKNAHIYACPSGTVEAFETRKQEKLQEIELQKKQDEIKSLEKKFGKKICVDHKSSNEAVTSIEEVPTLLYMGNNVPKNCAFTLGPFFQVLS